MFGRKIRTKLPHLTNFRVDDEDTRERDSIQKEKGKEYSDAKRKASVKDIAVGDTVLLKRMKKDNKLSTAFMNEEFVVLSKRGADVTVKSLTSGKEFRRNSAHMKKLEPSTTSYDISRGLDGINKPQNEQRSVSPIDSSERQAPPDELTAPEKRKRKEPAWFDNYMPHYIKKC